MNAPNPEIVSEGWFSSAGDLAFGFTAVEIIQQLSDDLLVLAAAIDHDTRPANALPADPGALVRRIGLRAGVAAEWLDRRQQLHEVWLREQAARPEGRGVVSAPQQERAVSSIEPTADAVAISRAANDSEVAAND